MTEVAPFSDITVATNTDQPKVSHLYNYNYFIHIDVDSWPSYILVVCQTTCNNVWTTSDIYGQIGNFCPKCINLDSEMV
jgi:hypothetical protein